MITRIKGKNITNFYSVKDNKKMRAVNDNELKSIYTAKPELVKEPKVEWEEICNFEGDLHYNNSWAFGGHINISEDDEVRVDKTIFRADLNEKHAFTNKILKEQDDEKSKSDAESIFKEELADFNEIMINSNDAMLAYCKLHKLDPRDTDCIELFKLVYPGEAYEIVDGKMKKKDKYVFTGYTDKISALESKIATVDIGSTLASTCITFENGSTIVTQA